MSLREEIKEELTYFPIMKTGDYERISNNIIKLIEKRIDSVGYPYDTEWYCQIAMDELKNDLKKEILK